MSSVRKWAKRALSGARVLVIGAAASHGLVSAARDTVSDGQIAEFPARANFYYTGIDNRAGQSGFNKDQAVTSVITIGGGLVAAWLIGIGIKHI